jgi:acetyl esterase
MTHFSQLTMFIQTELGLCIEDVQIVGHAQPITLRSYRPAVNGVSIPVVLYFHGGAFTSGTLDDGDVAASFIARRTPAWVISIDYSLAPRFPFPHATEDGYRALLWAAAHARAQRADPERIGLVGHDAGGNLATCVSAIARDRSDLKVGAQVLIAPLLDPSMTRVANEDAADSRLDLVACARRYADYLPSPMLRLHPYAAPIESRRLGGLPPALICSVLSDRLRLEAEKYASALIAAGVPTETTRYIQTSRDGAACNQETLSDVAAFLRNRLVGEEGLPSSTEPVDDEFDVSENS